VATAYCRCRTDSLCESCVGPGFQFLDRTAEFAGGHFLSTVRLIQCVAKPICQPTGQRCIAIGACNPVQPVYRQPLARICQVRAQFSLRNVLQLGQSADVAGASARQVSTQKPARPAPANRSRVASHRVPRQSISSVQRSTPARPNQPQRPAAAPQPGWPGAQRAARSAFPVAHFTALAPRVWSCSCGLTRTLTCSTGRFRRWAPMFPEYVAGRLLALLLPWLFT